MLPKKANVKWRTFSSIRRPLGRASGEGAWISTPKKTLLKAESGSILFRLFPITLILPYLKFVYAVKLIKIIDIYKISSQFSCCVGSSVAAGENTEFPESVRESLFTLFSV